ncbi:MAG: hypothetical protein AAGI06_07280 [Pseudomonadota bacterium]
MSGHCAAVPVGSASALAATLGDKCRFLSGGINPLHTIAPDFFDVSAMTVGPNSVLSARGKIAPIQYSGEPLKCVPGAISLRVSHVNVPNDESCLVAVTDSVPEFRRPTAMHVFDHDGGLVHRLDLIEGDDELILAAATAGHPIWRGNVQRFEADNLGARRPDNVIALMPQLAGGKNWKLMPFKDHLDHVIGDGGHQRFKRLMTLGSRETLRIDHRVLPKLLDFLSLHRMPFMRAFVRKSLAQIQAGPIQMIDVIDDVLMAYSKKSTSGLDLKSIKAAWLVPYATGYGKSLGLEIYDHDGACLAIFFSEEPHVSIGRTGWSELLLSLPSWG